jgi:hypothetical protein
MLSPPTNVEVINWPTSTMWFDEDGVLFSVPKPSTMASINMIYII